MTIIADHVLELGGHVTGVIPSALVIEVAHLGLSDLRVVSSMHERKALAGRIERRLYRHAGGIGTLEEFFEVLSWAQLGIHNKPCGLLNVSGYFDYLIQFMDHALSRDFLKAKDRALLIVEADPARLLDRFERISADQATQRFDRAGLSGFARSGSTFKVQRQSPHIPSIFANDSAIKALLKEEKTIAWPIRSRMFVLLGSAGSAVFSPKS
jgi:uncharacterized protein (TIGR00730 family)